MRKLTAYVWLTQEDYSHGKRWDCWACPMANALQRHFKEPFSVGSGCVTDGGGGFQSSLPYDAQEWIRRFDAGTAVPVPFLLKVRLPAYYIEQRQARDRHHVLMAFHQRGE